jgi:hypothetical protein
VKLVNLLRAAIQPDKLSQVLIPGFGSRACLERELIESFPLLSVLATDYPGVVEAAARRLRHPRVKYVGEDARNLDLRPGFNAAVVTDSVLPDCDSDT